MHSPFLAEWALESGGRNRGKPEERPWQPPLPAMAPCGEEAKVSAGKEKCELLITTLVSQPPVQSHAAPKRVRFCLALYCLATHTHIYTYICVL